MPLYEYRCKNNHEFERVILGESPSVLCPECGELAEKLMSMPAFFKFKGEGGYPSRRKFVKGSAPGTTRGTKVWGDYDPADKSINYMGTK
jgi:putative FmdB family regulatory protein